MECKYINVYIYITIKTNTMKTKTNNTDNRPLYGSVLVNETLNSEIEKRSIELDKMNESVNWTEEMEERGSILDKEIEELVSARTAFEYYNS